MTLGPFRLSAYGHRWAMLRPIPGFYFEECHIAVWLDLGNGSSDPLVGVQLSADLPAAVANLLDEVLP